MSDLSNVLHLAVNNRLAQSLKTQLIEQELSLQSVAQTPWVQTWSQWWEQWQSTALLRGRLPLNDMPERVLTDFEAEHVWEQLLVKALGSQSALLNTHATAKQLYQAWQIYHEYLSDDALRLSYQTDELQLFTSLKQQYTDALKSQNLWDKVRLTQHRLQWLETCDLSLPNKVVMHGFDDVPPYLLRWRSLLEEKGCTFEFADIADLAKTSFRYNALSQKEEIQQAAVWAVNQLASCKEGEPPRIAIVAPDIAEVSYALTSALDDALFQTFGADLSVQSLASHALSLSNHKGAKVAATDLYNVSLGEPLTNCPVTRNALLSLSIFSTSAQVSYDTFSEWLNSPFTLGTAEMRQALDARLRRWQWPTFSLRNLIVQLEKAPFSVPKSFLERLKLAEQWDASKTTGGEQLLTVDAFYDQAMTLLNTIGWAQKGANGALSSAAFQRKQAFESACYQFSQLRFDGRLRSFSGWLKMLQRFLSEQLHQPQSVGRAPIQVLGMLEAGGQTFDAIWILGLAAHAWPRESRPNPFLPMSLQREVGAPRADAHRERMYAEKLTRRLIGSARKVVASTYEWQDGKAILPSPLLESVAANWPNHERVMWQTLKGWQYQNRPEILWVEDAKAPEVPLGEKTPGGVGILDAQRKCPLMAFFDFRLGVRQGLETVEEGVPKQIMGTLVHELLETFWQAVKTQETLLSLSDDELSCQLNGLLETALQPWKTHFDEHYLALEQSRIHKLLMDWLALEKQRADFDVTALELRERVLIGGIAFDLTVDRVDQVDGGLLILDYKTGRAKATALLKDPIEAPQLAAYLFAIDGPISSLGYGLLHSDEGVGFSAVTEKESALPVKGRAYHFVREAQLDQEKDATQISWEAFLEGLKSQVSALATSIQQGEAVARFTNELDIAYAASLLALRLPEVRPQLKATFESVDVSEP